MKYLSRLGKKYGFFGGVSENQFGDFAVNFFTLELGSASTFLLVASHACAPDMPSLEKLTAYIADCKQQYGEMIARA